MVRKASLKDAGRIYDLISHYAREGFLLPLGLSDICERIREFCVFDDEGVMGCASLRIFTMDLGEVRSVAVDPQARGRGVGRSLVSFCLEEARELGLKRVFVLTKTPGFFEKCGFKAVDKRRLPHKVWRDCMGCPKFPECDEVAMIIDLEG